MRIVELEIENFKRLRALTVRPNGTAVVIGGRNGQGKSSALDAIWAALGGAKAAPQEPIRKGAKTAAVTLDLGDIRVTRRFTKSGTRLEVTTKEGASVKSPQAVLDELCAGIGFDPLAFSRMKPKEQAETLRKLAGLDLSDLDREIDRVFSERTLVNRELQRAQAAVASMPKVEPKKRASVDALLGELDKAAAQNRKRERIARERKEAEDTLAEVRGSIEKVRARLAQLEQNEKDLVAEVDRLDPESVPAVDEAPIRELIACIEQTNEQAAAYERRLEAEARAHKLAGEASALTARIEELRQEKADRIAAAAYPIEGLAVDDEGVTYQGIPLVQASSAEQVRVSAAIGLALNPKLRVLLIREGSLLDEDSMAALVAQAEAADAQIWVERVGDGDGVSVVIEDGAAREEAANAS